jgi:hypothetical protein
VPEQTPGGHEERTRIVCHLPLNDAGEHQAVDAIFTYLEGLRTQPLGVKGYTHSAARPPSHFGAWWSSSRRRWMREKVVLCFVDYKVNFNDQELTLILAELKDKIRTSYAEFTGKEQEEYWVVAHHVVR